MVFDIEEGYKKLNILCDDPKTMCKQCRGTGWIPVPANNIKDDYWFQMCSYCDGSGKSNNHSTPTSETSAG